MGTLWVMALTVLIEDPTTGSQFRATRHQWDRLHQPAGRIMLEDENGNPPPKPKTGKATPKPDTEQEK